MKNNLDNIIDKFDNAEETYLNKFRDKKVCIFGFGDYGKRVMKLLNTYGIETYCFCDNDSNKANGTLEYEGVRCIPLSELIKIKDEVTVFLALDAVDAVYNQLSDCGFASVFGLYERSIRHIKYWKNNCTDEIRNDIKTAYSILEDEKSKKIFEVYLNSCVDNIVSYTEVMTENQYFEDGLIEIKPDEVFVDVGAYIGDTFDVFIEEAKNGFEKYIAFELNHANAQIFNEKIQQMDKEIVNKIELIEKGLSNVNTTVRYTDNKVSSKITNAEGENVIEGEIVRLDDELDERISFLKMDIESAEMDALEGSREHIKKYKPTLAICVYHVPEHLWQVPLYIKSLVPEYKIYLRHYSRRHNETICYAIIEE